jgi:uncharacterized protein YxjI
MRERLFDFGDDFFIENEHGQRVIRVDGKMFRIRDTLNFEDMRGHELYHIKGRLVDIRETMDVKHANGSTAAVVHNALVTPFRDRWQINIPGGEDLTAQGNIVDHEYTITGRGHIPHAVVSKRWLRLRDTYGVEVNGPTDPALMLAITVVIDMMGHPGG